MTLFRKIDAAIGSVRRSFYLTPQEREVARWYQDDVDRAFRYSYAIGPGAVVLDIGGHQGDWAGEMFARYQCDVHVFEPVAGFATAIAKRFEHNPHIRVHPHGLGSATREVRIFLNGEGSSLYRPGGEAQTIRLIDAPVWFNEQRIARVDVVKINIEGGEYELLPRLIETGLIDQVEHLLVQFHTVGPDSDRKMREITEQLQRTHELVYRYEFVWDLWKRRRTAAAG